MKNIFFNILKILQEKEFESQKYKNITKRLLLNLSEIKDNVTKEQLKDVPLFISNVLIYNYQKTQNYDILIRILAQTVKKLFKKNYNSY